MSDSNSRILNEVETSEWFDWARNELMLGGISLPHEEDTVLFIEQARHLATRVRDIYGHLPSSLELRLVEAALVYQCWRLQRNVSAKSKRRPMRSTIRGVSATGYLRPIGTTGRHHLIEAEDRFRYVVTLPSGLWTETLPATEVVCSELARALGLNTPECAAVSMDLKSLAAAESNGPHSMKGRRRCASELWPGFRFVEPSVMNGGRREKVGRGFRHQLLTAAVLDAWLLDFAQVNYAAARDPTTEQVSTTFFDFSHCLAGADWDLYCRLARESSVSTPKEAPRVSAQLRHVQSLLRKVMQVNLNPLWRLAFEMPENWFGGSRSGLAFILQTIELRKLGLPQVFHKWMKAYGERESS